MDEERLGRLAIAPAAQAEPKRAAQRDPEATDERPNPVRHGEASGRKTVAVERSELRVQVINLEPPR
jgi:hypothetical protein